MYKRSSRYYQLRLSHKERPEMVYGERSVKVFKQPVTKVGDPCRHCQTPVTKQEHKPGWLPSGKAAWYYNWWLHCPKCAANYYLEAEKVVLR